MWFQLKVKNGKILVLIVCFGKKNYICKHIITVVFNICDFPKVDLKIEGNCKARVDEKWTPQFTWNWNIDNCFISTTIYIIRTTIKLIKIIANITRSIKRKGRKINMLLLNDQLDWLKRKKFVYYIFFSKDYSNKSYY